jgi:hypothetical protein
VRPQEGSAITMLGVADPLHWQYSQPEGITIELPKSLQDEQNRPCREAWALRITAAPLPGR